MENLKTLLEYAGVELVPNRLSESALVIIDAQKEFTEGKLKLDEMDAALAEAAKLLARARKTGMPIIHVMHQNKAGAALFDAQDRFVESIEQLEPAAGEAIATKGFANAFFNSALEAELEKTGRKKLIVFGYMTHMAVDATVRAAVERGFWTTVVGSACATRDLPDGFGKVIPAREVQRASLAMLRDRFAVVVRSESDLAD